MKKVLCVRRRRGSLCQYTEYSSVLANKAKQKQENRKKAIIEIMNYVYVLPMERAQKQ